MKKTLFTIVVMALMLISTSSYNRDNAKVEIGAYAPAFSLSNDNGALELAQMRGKYVLLNFWASSDAQSRVACNAYSAWAEANHLENLDFVAVNLDKDQTLFEEISRVDGLNAQTQYHVSGQAARQLSQEYGLDKGFGTVLIDPQGRIRAINPEISEIPSL